MDKSSRDTIMYNFIKNIFGQQQHMGYMYCIQLTGISISSKFTNNKLTNSCFGLGPTEFNYYWEIVGIRWIFFVSELGLSIDIGYECILLTFGRDANL